MSKRWGIVAAGNISHDFATAVNSLPGNTVDIAAIAARDAGRARAFAALHGIRHVLASYEELARSDLIDVVYIGSLNSEHYKLAKLFLENGKHVLCEKPLCVNRKQAKSLLDFAKQKKLFLMEAMWTRFLPLYYSLEEEIKPEKIGDIVHVVVNFGIVKPVQKRELGGSITLDIGIYALQFAQFVFKDKPTNITCRGSLNEHGADDRVAIILDYSGGRQAVLNVHSATRINNRAEVYGTNGYVEVLDQFYCAERLRRADGSLLEIPLHASSIPYNYPNSAGLAFQTREVQRCIDNGLLESPRMSHEDSLLLAELEDAVRAQLGARFPEDDLAY